MVSANAYFGAQCVVEALKNGADVVITGRVADPSMFIAPAITIGWDVNLWNLMGQAIVMGHLLECAGQVTGGYFPDPGYKDVLIPPGWGSPLPRCRRTAPLGSLRFPIQVEWSRWQPAKNSSYEIHDPSAYITPDVVADYTGVRMTQVGKDQVQVMGGKGRPRTDTLKVSIGYVDSYIGEGQISYGGPGAVARGKLALEIVADS